MLSGRCPWCGKNTAGQDLTTCAKTHPVAETLWNIQKMTEDLDNPRWRVITALNLEHVSPTIDEALPVFQGALSSQDLTVRATAAHVLLTKGHDLTLPEVMKYENLLRDGQNQLPLRLLLLAFYGARRFSMKAYEREWRNHALWLIVNAPGPEIPKGFLLLDPERDGVSFVQAKESWLNRLRIDPANTETIERAVDFFGPRDFDKSEELLTTAKQLEPSNAKWYRKLGELLMLKVINKTGDEQKQIGLRSIAELEEASRKSADNQERRYLASLSSQVALKIGESDKARSYATEILHETYDPEASLDRRSRHVANIILGVIEFQAGNNEAAKSYLHAAGGLVADICPPLLSLAREMLAGGELHAVIEYLRVCAPFLNRDAHEADQWIYDIEHGKTPNFGPNLEYL
jgi:hypothetical protein